MTFLVKLSALVLLLVSTSLSLSADPKATIAGRFRIRSPNGNYYSKTKTLVFVDAYKKKHSCTIKKKDSGYFSIRLPQGISYLSYIHYSDGGDYVKRLPEGYVEVMLDSPDRIYYVGDIVINWDIEVNDENELVGLSGAFGIIGGIGDIIIKQAREKRMATDARPILVGIVPGTLAHIAGEFETDTTRIITAPIHPRK